MALLRRILPFSRLGVAVWAWRNRDELGKWARFAGRSANRLASGDRADVALEARLRFALTRDPRTRGEPGLDVQVVGGVASLSGTVSREAHDAAREIAERTPGVSRVRDALRDRRGRRGRRLRHAS